jgi:MFS family permease
MAAFFVGLLSLGTFVLTPIVGWLGDRIAKPQLSAVCMAFGAVSMAMLLHQSGQIWYLVLSVLLQAIAESANPLSWAIMQQSFSQVQVYTLGLRISEM